MSQYQVVVAGTITEAGMCCGAKIGEAAEPYQRTIDSMAADGWEYVGVFPHTVTGKYCFIIPDTYNVNLLVFKK